MFGEKWAGRMNKGTGTAKLMAVAGVVFVVLLEIPTVISTKGQDR